MSFAYIRQFLFVLTIAFCTGLFVRTASAATCNSAALTSVAYGQSGVHVANIQQCLIEAGYTIPAGATGYYGTQTQTAVKEFYRVRLNMGDWHGNSVGPQGRDILGTLSQVRTKNTLGAKATSYAYKQVSSSEELQKYINASSNGYIYGFGLSNPTDGDLMRDGGWQNIGQAESVNDTAVAANKSSSASRYSETNVQVTGIDEPDVVKTDGDYLYISSPDSIPVFREMSVDDIATDVIELRNTYDTVDVVDAFPLSELGVISTGEIEESGEMLLVDNDLLIFTYNSIVAYDISDPKSPKKKWDRAYGENVQLVTARANDGVVYLVTSTYLRRDRPCPSVPLMDSGMSLPCSRIWVPENLEHLNTSYSVMKLDPSNGKVGDAITFAGKADNTVVAMFENNIYITHQEPSQIEAVALNFVASELTDMLSANTRARIATIVRYNISNESKLNEITTIIEGEVASMNENEALRFETEIQNRFTSYMKDHVRDIDRTLVTRISPKTLTIEEVKSIPGHLLNQFSLDEYEGYLRVAVTVGDRWDMRDAQVNDVYVLNDKLEIVGSVLDLGLTEQIYSARFIADRGYVVTFRQTDPFYVFDLSNPINPKMTGELKIPGYSSYLEAIDQNTVLGVGRNGGNVKLSLFDVTNSALPVERAVYSLKESWSEVENNHHAFLRDSKHGIVFIPANAGGYVISYANNTLSLKAAVRGYDVRRAVFIDDYFYVVGDSKLTVLNENTWKEEAMLEL